MHEFEIHEQVIDRVLNKAFNCKEPLTNKAVGEGRTFIIRAPVSASLYALRGMEATYIKSSRGVLVRLGGRNQSPALATLVLDYVRPAHIEFGAGVEVSDVQQAIDVLNFFRTIMDDIELELKKGAQEASRLSVKSD